MGTFTYIHNGTCFTGSVQYQEATDDYAGRVTNMGDDVQITYSGPHPGACLQAFKAAVRDYSEANLLQEFKEISGFNSPDEMAAYEKGQEHMETRMMRYITEWDGRENSELGHLLKRKLTEMEGKL